jgi:hypothetical protein
VGWGLNVEWWGFGLAFNNKLGSGGSTGFWLDPVADPGIFFLGGH